MARSCSRRPVRGERGAVALEAALTFPILLIVLLGIIEFTFLMRDHAVVVSDTRLAARVASTGADAGPGVCAAGAGAPPCVPANVPALAQEAADAVQRSGSAMPVDQIQYLLVYKANDNGYPGTMSSMPTSCSGVSSCVMFKWWKAEDKFRYYSGTWDPKTINACFPGTSAFPLDRLGIQLVAKHENFTGMFGSYFTLQDHAVMDFEPLDTQHCKGGTHP